MQKKLNKIANDTNLFLKKFVKKQKKSKLIIPMKYGLFSGGKKIRSKILIDIGSLFRLNYKSLIVIGSAVECIHAYSLIHDDLPGMDDDDMRRGKLTTHKKFGEATAILAGNSLLTLAFELLSDQKTHPSPSVRSDIVHHLAEISGYRGLAGGQSLDLLYEKQFVTEKQIILMHELKTAKLFEFCMVAPLVLSKIKNKKNIDEYRTYGKNFGLIFQATDDLLDFTGKKNIIGKTAQKDLKKNKGTIMKYKSIDSVKTYCYDLAEISTSSSSPFKAKNNIFYKLIFDIIERTA